MPPTRDLDAAAGDPAPLSALDRLGGLPSAVMHKIVVEPAAGGWIVHCAALAGTAMFRSGAQAEAAGRDLGRAFARSGLDAEVVIRDLRRVEIATAVYFG